MLWEGMLLLIMIMSAPVICPVQGVLFVHRFQFVIQLVTTNDQLPTVSNEKPCIRDKSVYDHPCVIISRCGRVPTVQHSSSNGSYF